MSPLDLLLAVVAVAATGIALRRGQRIRRQRALLHDADSLLQGLVGVLPQGPTRRVALDLIDRIAAELGAR